MGSSFKYALLQLKNTKGFISSLLVMPIILILLVSITLAYSKIPMVGFTGNGEILSRIPGIRSQSVTSIDYFLGLSQGSLVVEFDEAGRLQQYHSSVENNPLIQLIEAGIANPAPSKIQIRPQISYSAGVNLFKFLTAATVLATLIILERNNGIYVRLKNARVSLTAHVLGECLAIFLIFLIASAVILLFYRFAGFEFGETRISDLAFLFSYSVFLSLGYYTFFGAYMKSEGSIWGVTTGVFFPLGICSGVLFPIEIMPNWMQAIGHISPQYYIQKSLVEGRMQWPAFIILAFISIFLFFMGIRRLGKRI
ncbi:MAG: ABC transporter permease [Eubacteriales bacterium]|nr:ABC transporter permease [Eubacteriales bacterium]